MEAARRVYSLDKDWSFSLGARDEGIESSHCDIYNHAKAGSCRGVPQSAFNCTAWELVDLPHDWSVKQPFDKNGIGSWGYKPKGSAWYRKVFYLDKSFDGKQLLITFDGVAKDATVYFNGSVVGRNYTAYAPFTVDVTDRAHFGTEPNVLAVFVDANSWEGWWYEGAGIYRHVDLTVKDKRHITEYGVFVNPQKNEDSDDWTVNIQIELENSDYSDTELDVCAEVFDKYGNPVIAASQKAELKAYSKNTIILSGQCADPQLWDLDSPDLYKCRVTVQADEKTVDEDSVSFGFRTISIDADKGFFLNGRSIKLFGTCNHQDHAGVGVAVPDSVHEYRIKRLKEMGSNAYRCAHGMPHKELLDECDRQGMLVMDENRNYETGGDYLDQLRKMVLRDRNHPSVVMYSIFNEEPLQSSYDGQRMAQRMRAEIRGLDDTRFVTGAMHGGILEESGAAAALDVVGINYQSWLFDDYKKKFPDTPVVCSETTSSFSVRGCYETDMSRNQIAEYDEVSSNWGNTVRDTWQGIMSRDFLMGGFMWTGFDYLGEPTPCPWPAVSSFFGMMDTCGNPKGGYWVSRAIFSQEKVCKVLPHWNFKGREGEPIKVMSCTNCEMAELFVNGKSYGKKSIDKLRQETWEVPYEPGELKLVGYDKNGMELASDTVMTTGEAVAVKVVPYKDEITAGDAALVNFIAVDENGLEVPDANFELEIKCESGKILGTANGDPNCHEAFDGNIRSIFNGRCQATVSSIGAGESIKVSCKSKSGICGDAEIKVTPGNAKEYIESVMEIYIGGWRMSSKLLDEKPDPNTVISETDMNSYEPVSVIEAQGKFWDSEGKWALYRTVADIPEKINGSQPTLIFYGLWGECEVWINGRKVGSTEGVWANRVDIPITPDLSGKQEITVTVRSKNKSGAGICGGVVIR